MHLMMHLMMHEAPVASSNSIIAPHYPIGSGLTFTRKSRDLQSSLPPGTGPSALSQYDNGDTALTSRDGEILGLVVRFSILPPLRENLFMIST